MPTVLIADDDPRLVEMLRMTLAYEGFSVVVAHDGETALREVQRSRSNLIVLDCLMPLRSGVEVAEEIQRAAAPPILSALGLRYSSSEGCSGCAGSSACYRTRRCAKTTTLQERHVPSKSASPRCSRSAMV